MKSLILFSLILFVNINAVLIVDYETGECENTYPLKRLWDLRYAPPSSIVDWQSLYTESQVTAPFDNTIQATYWDY